MNNRGFMRLTTIFILLALSLGLLYTTAQEAGISKENITETFSATLRNQTSNFSLNISLEETPELSNALNYYIDGVVRAAGELGVWIAKFVAENPQAPYKLMLILLVVSMCAPIIIVLFKLLIIIFLLVKEHRQNKKEKRELKRLEKSGKS